MFNMRFTVFITLFTAASVYGTPAKPIEPMGIASLADDVFDQGDGFYLASYNESGALIVNFTPTAKLETTTPVEQLTTRVLNTLDKRGTTCSGLGSGDLGSLDAANVELANNAGAQGWHSAGHWGWVHKNAETSFFCSYKENWLTYQLIIDMHIVVSSRCGQSGYGYDRRTNGGGASDLAVGRTFRGDHFCDDHTHG